MVAILQALLRLLVVFLAAVGTWAGVELKLPGAPTQAEREASADEVREHSLDVAARIEETGLGSLPAAAQLPATVPAVESPADVVAPVSTPTPTATPSVIPKPTPAPAVSPAQPTPAPTPAPLPTPEKTYAETKLPQTLYDPVDNAAENAESNFDDEALAKKTTVNLACMRREGLAVHVDSGSGVVISPDGLIVTNAHVAYNFLLEDEGVECTITHPSFPVFGYRGQAVFVSPDWIRQNGRAISLGGGTGTGENDYAFVTFAKSAAPTLLGSLAYAPVSVSEPVAEPGDDITVAGFPGSASTLEGFGSAARLKVDEVEVEDTDSFDRQTADIVQTGRTLVAASGSSGGGGFKDGQLIGITATIYAIDGGNGLNLLSAAWINRDLRRDRDVSIADLVAEDPRAAAASFWEEDGVALAETVRGYLD
jgi:hypothetical protein